MTTDARETMHLLKDWQKTTLHPKKHFLELNIGLSTVGTTTHIVSELKMSHYLQEC